MMYLSRNPQMETRAPWKWLLRAREQTDALLYRKIAARRADPNATQRKDVLATLLLARDEDGEGLSDQELRDELMTALVAGHETTATALAWTFERLLHTPVVHARLRDEVRALGKQPAADKLAALPYLDATVKEALRLRPVVPVVGRVLQRPCHIGGYDLPEGAPWAPASSSRSVTRSSTRNPTRSGRSASWGCSRILPAGCRSAAASGAASAPGSPCTR
jgi:cytochrome P450